MLLSRSLLLLSRSLFLQMRDRKLGQAIGCSKLGLGVTNKTDLKRHFTLVHAAAVDLHVCVCVCVYVCACV